MNTIFIWKSQPWYLCSGFQGEEPVDLKITCPNQSNVPGYSTTLLPLTTVTATVTAAATATTTTIKSDSGSAADLGDEKTLGDTILIFLSFLCLKLFIM